MTVRAPIPSSSWRSPIRPASSAPWAPPPSAPARKLPVEATVTADVSFADREDKVGFTMVPKLTAKVPGWEKADIEATMKVAHDICPISDLIRHAHEVELVAG